MLGHVGVRTFWPVIQFLPWFFLGVALLVQSARKAPASAGHGRASGSREE